MITKVSSVSFSGNQPTVNAELKAKEAMDMMRKVQKSWKFMEQLEKESKNLKENVPEKIKTDEVKISKTE